MMQRDLTAAMLSRASITDLVARRVYWKRRPQGVRGSAIIMHRIHGRPIYTLEARSALTPYIVQFDAIGATYAEALAISLAVEGVLAALTQRPFEGAFITRERDDDPADDGPQASPISTDFLVSLDAQVWHRTA